MNKALTSITLTTLIVAGGIAAHAVPVDAARPDHRRIEVTHGRFHTLPAGADLGYHVGGGAIMVRSDRHGGTTAVVVQATGLDANTTYKVHVHNQPCSATPAGGGHYQSEIGGPADSTNEIWPTITTNSWGRGFGSAVHAERARDDAQSIVIHYPEDSSIRLACLDLK